MTMRRSLLALAGGAWLALRAHARQHIRLRVRNASSQVFEHVWQGHPQSGTDIDLGPLDPGVTGVLQDGGLLPGSYTFVCTIAPHDGGLRVVAAREH